MADCYFAELDPRDTGGRFAASPATAGPWAPEFQHGGPPNALAVTVAERALRAHTQRDDFVAVRLAADFVRPVPVAEIDVTTRIVRAARIAALVEVVLTSEGRDCLVSRIWFVRVRDTSDIAAPLADAVEPEGRPGLPEFAFGYGASVDWRFVRGRMSAPGPAAAWARPRLPVLEGSEYSSLARTVVLADSGSGVSAELDWSTWSFLNVDLDVHLARPVEGEWLLLDAATHLGAHGAALARSTISDVRGVVGAGLQTLVLAPKSMS